jgi:hypothetical protein
MQMTVLLWLSAILELIPVIKMKIEVTKKHKYLVQALIASGVLYYFSQNMAERGLVATFVLIAYIVFSSFIVHRPNSKFLNIIITAILPAGLVTGVILSLIFFPNLSLFFKVGSLFGFAILFYIISLVNNVFLVVESREEVIPLYRVASTWSKILIVIVAIPLLAGIFKISYNPLLESFLAGAASLLFYLYLVWSLRYNPDTKKYKIGEISSIVTLGVFLTISANLAVSFFPSETFLRALFVSSILIFGISYVEAHLKNVINRRLITEHLLISILFLFLLIFFKP